jgi:hypothetical protein
LRHLNLVLAGTATLFLLLFAGTAVEAAPQRDAPPGQHLPQHGEGGPAPTGDSHTMDRLPSGSALPGGDTLASHHVDETALCPDTTLPRLNDRNGRLDLAAPFRHTDHSYARSARAPPRCCARGGPVG